MHWRGPHGAALGMVSLSGRPAILTGRATRPLKPKRLGDQSSRGFSKRIPADPRFERLWQVRPARFHHGRDPFAPTGRSPFDIKDEKSHIRPTPALITMP